MTKLTKLLSLVLALLMVVAVLAACGEHTSDTEPDTTPEVTDPETTVPPVTTAPDPETTEPAPETTEPETTEPETTEPEVVIVPVEPELEAGEHAEHAWYTFATFTPYDAKQEDGTIGYLAVHCRYAGCDAIQDNKIQPVLVNLDFENFNGTLSDYATAAENVDILRKSPSTTKGNIADGMWVGGVTSQNIIEFTPGWKNNSQYYLSIDMQISTNPQAGKNLQFLAPGLTSAANQSRYLFQIGKRNAEDGKYYAHQNFTGVYPLDGVTLEQGEWYRMEYIMNIGDGSVLKDETNPEAILYYSPGTVTVFITKLARAADGTMVMVGSRELLGTFDGLGPMFDDKTGETLIMDTSIIKIDSSRAVGAFDNLIVALPAIDKP